MLTMNNTALKSRIIKRAEELRAAEMPLLTRALFEIFEKNGNRLEYENVYFRRREFLSVYALAVIAEKRPEDVEKLEEVLRGICTEETWALPAHCDTKKRPDIEKELDLFNSETAGALSEIIADCGGLLDKELQRRVKEEIFRRVLQPFVEGGPFGFENAPHNWNAVCCGSIGVALINCGEELLGKAEAERGLERIDSSLARFIDSFPEDGVCLEGAGYFNYGMSFLTAYVRRYEERKGKKADFFYVPKTKALAEFPNVVYFGNGMAVNFSDASEEEKLHAGILQEFQAAFGTEYTIDERIVSELDTDPCYRFLPLADDLKYGGELKTGKGKGSGRVSFLKDAEWLIAENPKGCGFAIKGGHNAEPHNHNDVGSFIYLNGKETVACDLGAGEYTADYFGAKRYEILCNSSLGHSLPVIGGKGQKEGKDARTEGFKAVFEENKVIVATDLTACYEGTDAKAVFRKAVFDRLNGDLEITDEIVADAEVSDRIISKHDIADRIDVLSDDCELQMRTEIFMNHKGEAEKVFIFEIKEKKNGVDQKGYYSKRFHSISYRLHT